MKHIRSISCRRPCGAAVWQDVVCKTAVGLNTFFTFLGGSSPFLMYLEDKCDLPQPNDTTDGGTGEETA